MGILLWVGVALGMTDAQAFQSKIFGFDASGRAWLLPELMCVVPGTEIRVGADVVNRAGYREGLAAEAFIWRATRSNGFFEQWGPRHGPAFGSFRRDPRWSQAIRLRVPENVGGFGQLEVATQGAQNDWMQLVGVPAMGIGRTPRDAWSDRCEWGPPGVYVSEPDESGPIPAPPPGGGGGPRACQDHCEAGAQCTDYCPSAATCQYVGAARPFFRVISCRN